MQGKKMIRKIKEITAEEENFRVEQSPVDSRIGVIKRDFVAPVPINSYIIKVFKVTGYDQDCDGSALARLAAVDNKGDTTGWVQHNIGLYEDTGWLIDHPEELDELAKG